MPRRATPRSTPFGPRETVCLPSRWPASRAFQLPRASSLALYYVFWQARAQDAAAVAQPTPRPAPGVVSPAALGRGVGCGSYLAAVAAEATAPMPTASPAAAAGLWSEPATASAALPWLCATAATTPAPVEGCEEGETPAAPAVAEEAGECDNGASGAGRRLLPPGVAGCTSPPMVGSGSCSCSTTSEPVSVSPSGSAVDVVAVPVAWPSTFSASRCCWM